MEDPVFPRELSEILAILKLRQKNASWTLNHDHSGSVNLNMTWTIPEVHSLSTVHMAPPAVITRKPPSTQRRDQRKNEEFWRKKQEQFYRQRSSRKSDETLTDRSMPSPNKQKVSANCQTCVTLVENECVGEQTDFTSPKVECVHQSCQTDKAPLTITSHVGVSSVHESIHEKQEPITVTVAVAEDNGQSCDDHLSTNQLATPVCESIPDIFALQQTLDTTNKRGHELHNENMHLLTELQQQKVTGECVGEYIKEIRTCEVENENLRSKLCELQNEKTNLQQKLNKSMENTQTSTQSVVNLKLKYEQLQGELTQLRDKLETSLSLNIGHKDYIAELQSAMEEGKRENLRLKSSMDYDNYFIHPRHAQQTGRRSYYRGRRR
jgi:hypothetical protein